MSAIHEAVPDPATRGPGYRCAVVRQRKGQLDGAKLMPTSSPCLEVMAIRYGMNKDTLVAFINLAE